MKEMVTLQRLKIPASLHKCLATTNLIESPHSGIRKRTHNVYRWRDADMAGRWELPPGYSLRSISGGSMVSFGPLAAILGRESRASKKEK
jgi:hypothetical protein